MATNNHCYNFDAALQLKDAGLVASSAAAQVSSADKILDLGAGYVEGDLVIDRTATEVDTGNEKYEIEWQLSASSTFASGIFCATVIKVGDSTVNGSSADTPATGRIVQGVSNEYDGTIYRYARLYTRIAGTIATGINYSAYLSMDR
jgi:hypothetical protein